MIIAFAGYNGYIGKMIAEDRKKDRLIRLSRELLYSDPEVLAGTIKGADLVLNLAGSPINVRWTRKNKRRIEASRHEVNRRLVEAVNLLDKKPAMFITASAIGIYETGYTHTETHHQLADNYLSKVVRLWEAPLDNLSPEVKSVRLRTGIVLGRQSRAFKPFLLASRLGIVPVLGSGKQVFSFIHQEDLVAACRFIIDKGHGGIYHLSAPHPVDYATFARTLAKTGGKRLIIGIPVIALRLALGEAHIMVSEGPRVLPERLQEEGFTFKFPDAGSVLYNLMREH